MAVSESQQSKLMRTMKKGSLFTSRHRWRLDLGDGASVPVRIMGPFLLLLIGAMPSKLHSAEPDTLAICPADIRIDNYRYQQFFYAGDGTLQSVSVSATTTLPPSCQRLTLPVKGNILWVAPAGRDLSTESIAQLGLLGQFQPDRPAVSDVIMISQAELEPTALPLDVSVLTEFKSQPFGVDERVDILAPDHLICRAGNNIAGVHLHAGRPWQRAQQLELHLHAQGHGDFVVAIGDEQRDVTETPVRLGTVSLSPDSGDSSEYHFPLPENELAWTSLTLLCPDTDAAIQLLSLSLQSTAAGISVAQPPVAEVPVDQTIDGTGQTLQRGAWLWSPNLWRQQPAFIWQTSQKQQLSEIYVSVDLSPDGTIADSLAFGAFVEQAREHDLDVWVVFGDPHDVLPGNQAALEQRVTAMLNYNQQAPTSARISGLQLDIEPYLLAGFASAQPYWRDRYLSVIQQLHQRIDGQLTLDLVVPAWWGRHGAWGNQWFDALPTSHLRLSIMNYHTSSERLRSNAEPFLSWGARAGVPVIIGLESGALPDETHRRYRQHDSAGELWLLTLNDEALFVLFDQPQTDLPGQAFSFAFDYAVPASDYTFAGDLARLENIAAEMTEEWRTRRAFAGIAIHGLDDDRVRTGTP